MIEIRDTGIGMDEETLKKIFSPFERAAQNVNSEGFGLGLFLTKGLVKVLDGTINVESELGKGSTFTVTLKHRIADESYYVKKYIEESGTGSEILEGRNILLAEDNDLNAELAVDLLEEKGMIVTRTADGKSALAQFCNTAPGTFDLILMDIMMPEMNGYETTKAIRNLPDRPDGKEIPIIAMTANAFTEDVQAALNAGMDDHVAKPVDMSILISVITKHIER